MSNTISSRSEIPDAPFYVLSNDSFMSGWGPARNAVNTVILPCESLEQAETVYDNATDRPEQKRVRIVGEKPRIKPGHVYSLLLNDGRCYWYHTNRPFAHHRQRRAS